MRHFPERLVAQVLPLVVMALNCLLLAVYLRLDPRANFAAFLLVLFPLVGLGALCFSEFVEEGLRVQLGKFLLVATILLMVTLGLFLIRQHKFGPGSESAWFLTALDFIPLLTATFFMLLALYYVNRVLSGDPEADRLLRSHPLQSLAFFVILFLFTTISFGLFFAINDLRERNDGAYGLLGPVLPIDSVGTEKHSEVAGPPRLGQPQLGGPANTTRLDFPEGETGLMFEGSVVLETYRGRSPVQEIVATNTPSLRSLIQELRELTRRSPVVLVLCGHASDSTPRTARYASNYEISDARLRSVQLELIRQLSLNGVDIGRSIQWILLPFSSAEAFCSPMSQRNQVGRPQRPSVEIFTLPLGDYGTNETPERTFRRVPELLDFFYFSAYTITTTGYGDYVPVSRSAKIGTMVANVFEFVYIAVLLGMLVSRASAPTKGRGDSAAA